MFDATRRGTFLLTLAQAWHALSGYVIFVSAARILGEETFGDFGLVAWTMTAMETLVVAGAPRAVSYFIARSPRSSAGIAARGLRINFAIAGGLTALLALAAPAIAGIWHDPGTIAALRIAALDFVAFAAFAVLTQAVNGLHLFDRQASIWLVYSSVKVVAVVGLLEWGERIEWGMLGYVAASSLASLAAVAAGRGPVRRGVERELPTSREIVRFGFPVAAHAMMFMVLLTADLWAAKWATADRAVAGGYVAAGTLARALYFVFLAFGEALFPTVARELKSGPRERAAAAARAGLGSLFGLLVPAVGLATGAAAPALAAVYGGTADPSGAGYRDAAPFLVLLAPAAAALTLVAVHAAVLSAAGRPARTAWVILGLLVVNTGAVFGAARLHGAVGAATGALLSSVVGLIVIASWARTIFGVWLVPARSLAAGIAVALALHFVLGLWCPEGPWVLAYGGALYAAGCAVLLAAGALPLFRSRGEPA